ncbi:MAG TPA: AraC family transcriptional regulator [Polyangiales bacterium]|nr:AraC family transcriptional regulator [Polyangiales bacterium]
MDRSAETPKPRQLELVHPRRDERIAQAIELMRSALHECWTVSKLARRVGLSRPAFARRFVADRGVSPLRYLARERMQRAAELLWRTDWNLAKIAERVGYGSQFAFNRAFKRHHQQAPGAFRRQARFLPPVLRAA